MNIQRDSINAFFQLSRSTLIAGVVVCVSATAHAEDKSKSAKPKTITPPNAIIEQVQAIQSRASVLMENWYDEASIIKDAHNNVFAARGWDSEADQFTLQLINQITDISPMQNQEREELFIRAYQDRLGLSDEQAQMLGDEMRQESMRFTMQHFTELLPIASEIISTRSQNKPFTAEMVQRWSQKLEPLMNDALESVNRVRGKLEATMTPEQKELLDYDMESVMKRHNDVKEMVQDWKAGNWDPRDWGLHNDPVHRGQVLTAIENDRRKDVLVARAEGNQQPNLDATGRDPSAWERYVKWFVNEFECDEKQRIAADGILKQHEKEAMNYLAAKADDIEYNERRADESLSESKRKYHRKQAERLRAPVERIFDRMCRKLESNVLDRAQRMKLRKSNIADKKQRTKDGGKSSGKPTDRKTAKR